jgi:hypothetical protein
VPELAIAPEVAELELAIAPAPEGVRPTGPQAEPIALVVAGAARPTVPAAERVVLAVAEPENASVATMFLGAAVPARAVPLAVVAVG